MELYVLGVWVDFWSDFWTWYVLDSVTFCELALEADCFSRTLIVLYPGYDRELLRGNHDPGFLQTGLVDYFGHLFENDLL